MEQLPKIGEMKRREAEMFAGLPELTEAGEHQRQIYELTTEVQGFHP